MGNPRSFTTKLNANNEQMRSFLKRRGCTSMKAKKAAMERAATMPNSLEPIRSKALLANVSVRP